MVAWIIMVTFRNNCAGISLGNPLSFLEISYVGTTYRCILTKSKETQDKEKRENKFITISHSLLKTKN
jgi:hypothetical protein